MASTTPDQTLEQVHPALVKDTVYQLYAPEGNPAVDVVFFHGLQLGDYKQAWLKTWQADADKPNGCWPKRLLSKDFPNARMLSVSYDSSARGGRQDLVAIRKELTAALLVRDVGVGERPLILVGHSLGGFVLVDVCNELYAQAQRSEAHKKALDSMAGLVFYSTPGAGTHLADLVPVKAFADGAVMQYLCTLSKDAGRVRDNFELLRDERRWKTLGFGEQNPTKLSGGLLKWFNAIVVDEASASVFAPNAVMIKADHLTVCRPSDNNDLGYARLKDYLVEQLEEAKKVAKYLASVRTDDLVGRQHELKTLVDTLKAGRVAVITGGPGEGKSALAYEVAAILDGTLRFWDIKDVDLGGQEWRGLSKAVSLNNLAVKCFGQGAMWATVRVRPFMVILYHNTEDILLADGDVAKAFYELVSTLHRNCAYQIITTRTTTAQRLMPQPASEPLKLSPLNDDVAAHFLIRKCQRQGKELEPLQAKKIATNVCACNALLLELLGNGLAAGDCTAQDIIDSGIRANQNTPLVHDKVKAVHDSLALLLGSYSDQLDWIAEMSLWHSFTVEQASSRTEMKKTKLLEKMVRLSILELAGERHSMHVLVREAAGELLEERSKHQPQLQQDAQKLFVHAMANVGDQAAKAAKIPKVHATLFPKLGNCRQFCPVPDSCVKNRHIMNRLCDLWYHLTRRGFYSAAEMVMQRVHDAHRQVLGEEHPRTLASMSNLATTLQELGEHAKAKTLHRDALEKRQRLLGKEHPRTLASMNNLANTLRDLGEHADAEALHRDVLEKRRRVLGEEHPRTLASMSNLATTLQELGEHAEAKTLHRDALEKRQRVLGDEHPDTLASMSNLATTLQELGEHAEAKTLHRDALEKQQRLLGKEHPRTLASMNNLANTLRDLGEHSDAEALHRGALEKRRRVLGEEHPRTLASMSNLATTLHKLGEHAGAEALHRDALEKRRRVLGKEHPDTRASINNLADMLHELGRHAEAEDLYRDA